MRVLVVHNSKYGNGKQVADAIAEGIRSKGHTVEVKGVEEVDVTALGAFEAFVVGSPTHMRGPTFKVGGFISKLSSVASGKPFVAWATIGVPSSQTVAKLEAKATKAKMRMLMTGKAFKVKDMKGPLEDGALAEAGIFGKEIGTHLGSA